MTNLTNINSITLKGRKLEYVENNVSTWKTDTYTKSKTVLTWNVIEDMINSVKPQVTATVNTFLAPSETWTIEKVEGAIPANPIYEFIEVRFIEDTVSTPIFTDAIGDQNYFIRNSTTESKNFAIVKILANYDFPSVCIPKTVVVVDPENTDSKKTYEVKVVILDISETSVLKTIIAPTVEYFTTSDVVSEIGEGLVDAPENPTVEGNEVKKTVEIFAKSFFLFKTQTLNFNLELNVSDFVDVLCVGANASGDKLKLDLLNCKTLYPVGTGFKEIVLSSNLDRLRDYANFPLFIRNRPIITIPQKFTCADNILKSEYIANHNFEKLIVLDVDYLITLQNPKLEKPIDRYTLWNEENRQMELFYRHRANVSNDVLFKKNNELYDQTYKLELIPDTTETKFYYKSDVTSNLPIYYFGSVIYDEDYVPYELSENDVNGNVNTIVIKGNKTFKVEVSEKFNKIKFQFKNTDGTSNIDYIIRYSMPDLSTEILNSEGLGTLFLNDGTTFIEAGLDDVTGGNWTYLPSAGLVNNTAHQCNTICKTIYLGVEYFNSEILTEDTTIFRYGRYIHPTDNNKGCFTDIYIPIECVDLDPETATQEEKDAKKEIVKKILFGENFTGTVNIYFYSDSNIATDFTTRSVNIVEQQNVFGRKFYIIDKDD